MPSTLNVYEFGYPHLLNGNTLYYFGNTEHLEIGSRVEVGSGSIIRCVDGMRLTLRNDRIIKINLYFEVFV